MNNADRLRSALSEHAPLVAILRGLEPANARAVFGALYDAGFVAVEVPLNSPEPLKSIEIGAAAFGEDLLVGAGTVLAPEDVAGIRDAGGQFVVSPNTDADVIGATKAAGLASLPGVSTPSEAFAALKAGADMLKAFPAEGLPPEIIKAWRAVLPADTWLLPVGGIMPERLAPYLAAGADGFGLGSAIFKPDWPAAEIGEKGRAFVAAYRALTD